MKRTIETQLSDWKNKKDRMPLIVLGARQVGKTYTVFNFGKSSFKDVAVFTLEGNAALQKIFDLDIDPVRIIHELERISLKKIDRNTLVFFDEVQACKNALTSLKYFCEQMPEQPIIAAGSLLGVAIMRGEFSFPVGKVERITMYPLAFDEFLNALGEDALLNVIADCFNANSEMPENVHERALRLYQEYLIIGGMPKAVDEYISKRDFDFVRVIQQNIILDYLDDMSKYSMPAKASKTRAVYNSIPDQLARENKKFMYQLVNSSARAATHEEGIICLNDGGLIVRVNKANEGKPPLYFYQDTLSYKIYMNDVGLLAAKSNIAPALITSHLGLSNEVRGALTENYIAAALAANGHTLYYWESKGNAEVDFLVEIGGLPIPIEAKSSDNVKAKSLSVFVNKFTPPYSIRISSKNFGLENNIKVVPLYAAFCIKP
jgi:predicted AAA+ superfamily ATPase